MTCKLHPKNTRFINNGFHQICAKCVDEMHEKTEGIIHHNAIKTIYNTDGTLRKINKKVKKRVRRTSFNKDHPTLSRIELFDEGLAIDCVKHGSHFEYSKYETPTGYTIVCLPCGKESRDEDKKDKAKEKPKEHRHYKTRDYLDGKKVECKKHGMHREYYIITTIVCKLCRIERVENDRVNKRVTYKAKPKPLL